MMIKQMVAGAAIVGTMGMGGLALASTASAAPVSTFGNGHSNVVRHSTPSLPKVKIQLPKAHLDVTGSASVAAKVNLGKVQVTPHGTTVQLPKASVSASASFGVHAGVNGGSIKVTPQAPHHWGH